MQITKLNKNLLSTHLHSYLSTLSYLSPTGDHTVESLLACFERMEQQGTTVYSAVEEDVGIVGTCSILIEHKFNRGGSRVAHLEDLVVHPDHQTKGIGKALLHTVIQHAKDAGCYKIILDADKDPSHIGYYEKFGFEQAGVFMKYVLS